MTRQLSTSPHRAARRTRRGLTLIELAVALVVGGAALAAGGAAFVTLTDRRSALLDDAQREERALGARRALTAWLEEARIDGSAALQAAAVSQRTAAGTRGDDTLRFTSAADDEVRVVRVFVLRDGAAPALVADLGGRNSEFQRIVLADSVDSFTVTVLSSAFGTRRWHRGWQGGALRPEALRLQLEPMAGSTLPAALREDVTVVLGALP